MALNFSQRLERLKVRTAELILWREDVCVALENWQFEGTPISLGDTWPTDEGTVHFSAKGQVPPEWDLADTRLQLDVGGESLIALDFGGDQVRRFGLDPYHQEFELSGHAFALEVESVARLPFGVKVRRPVLTRGRIAKINWPVHRLHLMLTQIAEALTVLDGHDAAPHMLELAENSLRSLNWPSQSTDFVQRLAPSPEQQEIWHATQIADNSLSLTPDQTASVESAEQKLTDKLAALKLRFPAQGQVAMTGHAHIDLAWLWPYAETRRKMRRTFHTVLALMKNDKDFRFNQSTAAYYAQIEQDDPDLLEQIVRRSDQGAWETTGGMWVEPDTNMPTGESLVRQLLYGQNYFENKFGARHSVCWLPDCFGFSPALPQLLRQAGIDSFFTYKVNWSETNTFPHDLFWWEGLDGSRVLTHTFFHPIQGYNGFVRPDGILPTWQGFRGKTLHPETLLSVGYGDGGGGPTAEMVERQHQLKNFPALPEVRWTRVDDFFSALHETADKRTLPTWSGEIYLEYHRATLTTQSHTKKLHRHAERALITAETLACLGHMIGAEYPQTLESDWRLVLKNEFHDILPGSSIREVYEDAERELSAVLENAHAAQRRALDNIVEKLPKSAGEKESSETILVVNPTLSTRALNLEMDGTYISTDDTIPPMSVATYSRAKLQASAGLISEDNLLENEHLRCTIGKDGTITNLVHKATGREAFFGRGNQLWVYPNENPRDYDAWDIEDDYAETGQELDRPVSIERVEDSPHRAVIRVVKTYRSSTITQDICLTANGRRIDLKTHIDWRERRTLLRTVSPINVRARKATFECAHGVIERATHDNTTWEATQFEVAAHRFADLSEPGFGVAILNNAKYGHSAKGNMLGLSLVRGPIYPDPFADEGEQSFTYALMPHSGTFEEGEVRQEAECLNQPLLAQKAAGSAIQTITPLSVDGIPVAISGLKAAEDGNGLVLRIYEPSGRRGAAKPIVLDNWNVGNVVNLMEDEQTFTSASELAPFEVKSWRITRL